jgi:membrane glycosyltransferase
VESAAEWRCHWCVAIPAEFEHSCLLAGECERGAKSRRCAAGMDYQVTITFRSFRFRKANTKLLCQFRAALVDVDEHDFGAGKTAAQKRDQRADRAGTNDCNAIRGASRRIPDGIESGLHIGGQHRTLQQHGLGQRHDSALRNIEKVLMRVERENNTTKLFFRSIFDPADRRVSILYRKRKMTAHEGRPHPFELALRHSPREHQSLCPAAQRAEKRPHAHLAGPWRGQSFLADFHPSRRDVPERLRNLSGAVGRHDIGSLLDYWYICCVISSSLHGPSGIRSRNRVLERSPLQSRQADATGNAMAGRRVLFAALMAVTMAGSIALAALALSPAGFSTIDIILIVLFAITLPWMVAGFWNAIIGFLILRFSSDSIAAVIPQASRIRGDAPISASTAILLCIRNELPERMLRNLQPMLAGIEKSGFGACFHLYVLSDTSDPHIASIEKERFIALAEHWRGRIAVTYRRRTVNTGYKAGNIRDFCEQWGDKHELAVTLDADSFMTAEAILRLVRLMEVDPKLGILQGLVVGLPSTSVFARIFQFGMRLGMRSYTIGSAWWQGDCGPYWGHNAVLRLGPFIAHCSLPVLSKDGTEDRHVLSHDQIEAALMRAAGYAVRVLPEEGLGWEENPPTLLEFIRRDLRWCQGNMQYWRFLGLPGLKAVSRYQLALAIVMFIGSPAWIGMLVLGTLSLAAADAPANFIRTDAGIVLFVCVLVMWFSPKIASVIDILLRPEFCREFGGPGRLLVNFAIETVYSILLCPILWFGHTIFLAGLLFGREIGWIGQIRDDHAVPFTLALRSLWPHTLLGCATLGILAATHPGAIPYVLFLAGGPALAIPFAMMTAWPSLGDLSARIGIGRLPEETIAPAALQALALPALEMAAPLPQPNSV